MLANSTVNMRSHTENAVAQRFCTPVTVPISRRGASGRTSGVGDCFPSWGIIGDCDDYVVTESLWAWTHVGLLNAGQMANHPGTRRWDGPRRRQLPNAAPRPR